MTAFDRVLPTVIGAMPAVISWAMNVTASNAM
jgi:hypothetical protein